MGDRAERSETIDEEAPSEATEVKTNEDAKDKPGKSVRRKLSGPLGLIFNIRMLRRVVQILFFLGINAYLFTAWFGMEQVTAFWTGFRDLLPTLPIIAPLEAPFAVLAGSFDTMQRVLTSGAFPFFTLGAMIIILTVVGRAGCGWVCPIGTIQDFITLPKRTKLRPSPQTEKELRRIKAYVFVVVMFFAVWVGISTLTGTADVLRASFGIFADAAFDPLNPAYILFVVAPEQTWPQSLETLWYVLSWDFVVWLQFAFVAIVFIISYWIPRWFCRWLCPAGWFYSVFSRDALIGIGRNPARCTPDTCNVCEEACPMNIRIRKFPYQHMYSPDCILCLECMSHCPNGAIELRFS
jgi:polyferredoxin